MKPNIPQNIIILFSSADDSYGVGEIIPVHSSTIIEWNGPDQIIRVKDLNNDAIVMDEELGFADIPYYSFHPIPHPVPEHGDDYFKSEIAGTTKLYNQILQEIDP